MRRPRRPSPDELMARFLERTRALIQMHGWSVTSVAGDPATGAPTFSYTVGFHASLGVAEVLLVGLPPQTAGHLLNDLGRGIRAGRYRGVGETGLALDSDLHGLAEGYPLRLVSRGRYSTFGHLHVAHRIHEADFPVVQLVWPDVEGVFPGEPGVAPRCARQLIRPERGGAA